MNCFRISFDTRLPSRQCYTCLRTEMNANHCLACVGLKECPAFAPIKSVVLFGAQFRSSKLARTVRLYIPELFIQFWYVPRLSSWVCTRIVPTILVRKNCRNNSDIKWIAFEFRLTHGFRVGSVIPAYAQRWTSPEGSIGAAWRNLHA